MIHLESKGILIQHDRRTGSSQVEVFDGPSGYRDAFERRLELELQLHDPAIEIVSINAGSLDDVKKTHSRYFASQLTSQTSKGAHGGHGFRWFRKLIQA